METLRAIDWSQVTKTSVFGTHNWLSAGCAESSNYGQLSSRVFGTFDTPLPRVLAVHVVEHPDAAVFFRHRQRQSVPRFRFLERP